MIEHLRTGRHLLHGHGIVPGRPAGNLRTVPEHLSDEWIAALDRAARDDAGLAEVARELDVVIQQTVTGTPAGTRSYHVVLTPAEVAVRPGPAPEAQLSFTTDHETARAVADGRLSAQAAFIDGRLRVGGDLRRLLDAQRAMARLGDTLAAAHRQT
jgi:hypothetical protein